MRKYVIAKGDAADDEEERGFSKDGDDTILTSDFIVGVVDTGVFIDATVEAPSDLLEMVECLFCAGEELISKIHPSVDKSGIFSLLCLAHAEHVMRSVVARGGGSVGADMIVLYDGLRRLLDATDIDGYVSRCVSETDDGGE